MAGFFAMRRQFALLDFALGGLFRRRQKTLGLVLGLAFVVFPLSATLFVTDGLRAEYEAGVSAMPDLLVQSVVAGRPALVDQSHLETIEHLPGVRSARARVWGYLFFAGISANVTVVGAAQPPSEDASLERGRAPSAPAEVALGSALADLLGVEPGNDVALVSAGTLHVLRVVGLFRSDSGLWTADVMWLTDQGARQLLGIPSGTSTDLALELTTMDEAKVIAKKIAEILPTARVLDRRRLARTYALTFGRRSGLLSVLFLPSLFAFLLLAWDRLSGLGRTEIAEIGVLRAVGWETGDVLTSRLWESFLVATTGSVLGLVVAYGYVFFLHAPGLADAIFGWSLLYPHFELTPQVDVLQLISLLSMVVVPFAAVSLVPTWRAATLDPDDAVRGLR